MLAIQRLNKAYEWLQQATSDIQMLRIEEINSLMPLLTPQTVKKLAYA
jgi:virulence-associated protein VapD